MFTSKTCTVCLLAAAALALAEDFNGTDQGPQAVWEEAINGPLPHWREGGTPPVDPNQSLYPYAVQIALPEDAPTSGLISSPPEYAPADGVLFRYSTNSWPLVVRDCVVALTADPAHDEIAYVVVTNSAIQVHAASLFAAGGADLSKVQFILELTNSIWLRDYGPHFIWQNEALGIVDSHYYPTRPLDNFLPTRLADEHLLMPSYDIGLYYSGGNFQPGPDRTGYTTTLVNQDNAGFGEEFISELYDTYQGIDTLQIFPRLPSSVDGTGHIDMWFYLVDEDTVLISEFIPGSHPTAISITNNAADYMANVLGFEVVRVPDSNSNGTSGIHYTYTNAYRVNDRIFIPTYGQGNPTHLARDAQALAGWQAAAPDAEIVPIDCYDIIPAAGAIHCIVMQVPRRTEAVPAVHVVSPDGGELILGTTSQPIRWAATDDFEVTSMDLYYSVDEGGTFEAVALGEDDDGDYTWNLPAVGSTDAVVKAVAHDGDGNTAEAVSENVFMIGHALQRVYDFSSGAGVDKWGFGYQTQNWFSLNAVRRPSDATTDISILQSGAYGKIAFSDATGGDTDVNRYRSPVPNSGRESTHIFEFIIEEDPSLVIDIELLWEGYGDNCLQMEMYVWDYVEGNWSDASGRFGENRFVDNQAANVDADLRGHIRSDFSRYVDIDGTLTLLLYAERPSQESMHDYIAVTVSYAYDGDFDGNGVIDMDDVEAYFDCFSGPGGGIPSGCDAGDQDADNDIDFADFAHTQRRFEAG